MKRSLAFLELCRKSKRARELEELRLAKEAGMTHEKTPARRGPHNMVRDHRSGIWSVRVPSSNGQRIHRMSTGQTDLGEALKVVDASGIQKLSILARAKCLTSDVAHILIAGHNTTCNEIADAWYRNLCMDFATNTATCYFQYARFLFMKIGCGNKPLNVVTREELYDFVNDTEVKESTRKTRLAALRSLYRHAAGHGHITGNIADTIKLNTSLLTVQQRERESAVPFTHEEYERIMASPETNQFWRWASSIGYWLGLRMSDVAGLEVASLGQDFAVLYPQKTGRRLVLPIHDPLIGSGVLRETFDGIRATLVPDQIYCFPELKLNYPFHPDGLRCSDSFKQVMRRAGIEGKSFHSFRHSFKVRLMQAGKSIEEISALMGHASTQTTEGYGRESA